jgi:glutamate-1-semialdehyde 2,1-aminomutase
LLTTESKSDRYEKRTSKSKDLYEQATKVLPAGVTYAIRQFEPYPFYVRKGTGSRIYDVDGNEYLDYWIGHGALIMGHCFAPVVREAKRQIELGSHLGFANEWEIKHAKQITKMVPSAKMVRPTNSGTEANMYAIRLARSYTGRTKIAKIEGSWHGGSDVLHKGVQYPFENSPSSGLDPNLVSNTVLVPFNDIARANKKVREVGRNEIACVVVEPVLGGGGNIPAEVEFLKSLRELCDSIGALLIFDEVITGFRLAAGGAQEFYRVKPDLTVLGKIVGGAAFPAGCFCGREDIMEKIDHLKYKNPAERSFHGGTYAGNPLVARAGYTLLSYLDSHKASVYPKLFNMGERARRNIQEIFEQNNFAGYATGEGPLLGVHFTKEKPHDVKTANVTKDTGLTERYFSFLLNNGIAFLAPQSAHMFISAAHTKDEIDHLVSKTEEFVAHEKSSSSHR